MAWAGYSDYGRKLRGEAYGLRVVYERDAAEEGAFIAHYSQGSAESKNGLHGHWAQYRGSRGHRCMRGNRDIVAALVIVQLTQ